MFSTRPRTACPGQPIDGAVVWREAPVIADGEPGFRGRRLSRELKALTIQPRRWRSDTIPILPCFLWAVRCTSLVSSIFSRFTNRPTQPLQAKNPTLERKIERQTQPDFTERIEPPVSVLEGFSNRFRTPISLSVCTTNLDGLTSFTPPPRCFADAMALTRIPMPLD